MIVKGILVPPNELAKISKICTESGMLEKQIEAKRYEIVYPFKSKQVAIVKNEFGAFEGARFNRALYCDDGETVETVLQGTFAVVGVDEDSFRDLSDDELENYLKRFELPERFFVDEGELCVAKFRPNEKQPQNSKLISYIWEGKYPPEKACCDDEQQALTRRMNKALQELLCVLPEEQHSYFNLFVEVMSTLHKREKLAAYNSGIEFGREMYYYKTQ